MNANGKVDEGKLPMPQEAEVSDASCVSETTKQIVNVFRRVLKRNEIHSNSDYFLSGGNSLNAMETITEIDEQLGRKVRVADLYACRTAARLGAFLDGVVYNPSVSVEKKPQTTLKKAPKQQKYAMSPMQQGMYVQSVLDPSGFSYHMPGAFRMEKEPDVERLKKAL